MLKTMLLVARRGERGKVLVEALTLCIARSKVGSVVNDDTVRKVIRSSLHEVWRGDELRLDVIWNILRQQPELTEEEAALPLLVFKSFEETLGVRVRLPEVLAQVPPEERVRLRPALRLDDQEIAKVVERLADVEAQDKNAEDMARFAGEASLSPGASSGQVAAPMRRRWPILLLSLTLVPIALVGAYVFYGMDHGAMAFDVADVADLVTLSDAKQLGGALVARIADPKWELLSGTERTRIASQLFDREFAKGIRSVTLTDGNARTRVVATELGGYRQVRAE